MLSKSEILFNSTSIVRQEGTGAKGSYVRQSVWK